MDGPSGDAIVTGIPVQVATGSDVAAVAAAEALINGLRAEGIDSAKVADFLRRQEHLD